MNDQEDHRQSVNDTVSLRLPGKRNRRPGNPDEPVCIALSSDEEGGDEDENSRSSTAEQAGDQQGRRVGLEEQGRTCQLKIVLPLAVWFSLNISSCTEH